MPDRYVVRELEGFRQIGPTAGVPGLSVVVLDSRVNYRLVKEYKSEETHKPVGGGRGPLPRDQARALVRRQGAELAARLNEANP